MRYGVPMRAPQPPSMGTLAAIASEQHGFVTAGQSKRAGVSYAALTRLSQRGYVERIEQGIYRIAVGVTVLPDVSEQLYLRYLALDPQRMPWSHERPRVFVSHESAAEVLGIGVIPADESTFTSQTRRTTVLGATRIRVASMPDSNWTYMTPARIPVTTAARTVVDLAAVGIGRDHVLRTFDDALARGMMAIDEVQAVAAERASHVRRTSIDWLRREIRSRGGA